MKLNVKNPVFLAPLEAINDIAFRLLCKKAGAGLTWTGMINPLSREKLCFDDKPIVQLFGNSEKGIKEFMKKHDKSVSGWDFNLGCPVARAKKSGVGAYLVDLKIIERILKIMRKNTKKPVFVKIRKSRISLKIAKLAEKIKLDAVILHPRTRDQGYSGKGDVAFAEKIKKKIKIPLIYSGDVDEKNYAKFLQKFDYIMIGRAAIGNPGIFGKKEFGFQDYLKLAEKYNVKFNQIRMHAMYFTKGKKGARKFRKKIMGCKDFEELKKVF